MTARDHVDGGKVGGGGADAGGGVGGNGGGISSLASIPG